MKVKLLILLLIITGAAFGQTTTNNQPWYFFKYKLSADSLYANKAFYAPIRDTNWTPSQVGALVYQDSDDTFYGWTGVKWQNIALTSGGSGTVTSVTLTAPTGFTVTGSPLTTSGTLALSTTLSGLLYGNGSNTIGAATVVAPLGFSGGSLSITQADASTDGYLGSSDYTNFLAGYNKRPIALSVTGTSTKTITLDQGDGSQLTADFDDNGGLNTIIQDGRVSGGDIIWLSGYTYNVSPAVYYIAGVQYASVSTDLTLSTADATHGRFDLFVLTTSGTVEVIEGTAAASPLTPNYNPATQLPLYYILVAAASTQPTNVTQNYVYRENTEWTTATSGGTINANSSSTAYNGTKSVEGTAVTSGHYITFTTSATVLSYDNLSFAIKSKATWGSRKMIFQFYNGSTPVGEPVAFAENRYGFSSSNTSTWQIITIPISMFIANGATITQLKITASQGSGSLGFYIDDVQLQGVGQVPTVLQGESTTASAPLYKVGFDIRADTTVLSTRANVINIVDSLGLLGGGGGGTPTLDAVLDNNSTLAGDVEIDGDGTNFWALIEFAGYSWNTEPEPTDGTWSNFNMDQYNFDLSFTDGTSTAKIVGQFPSANTAQLRLFANDGSDMHDIDIKSDQIKIEATSVPTHLLLIGIPVYADEAAAVIGGIPTGTVYRTTTGELRIKL
jgi:hypothetical protein